MVEQLGDLIRTNLRQCDVAARYTDMQYVVMLSRKMCIRDSSQPDGGAEAITVTLRRRPGDGADKLNQTVNSTNACLLYTSPKIWNAL